VLKAAAKAVDDSERYTALSSVRINNSETLEQRLMSFQKEGVKFGLRCGGRVSEGGGWSRGGASSLTCQQRLQKATADGRGHPSTGGRQPEGS
jgi:hypothetical protein